MRAFTVALILWNKGGYRIPVWKSYLRQLQQKCLLLKELPVTVRYKTEQSIMGQNFTEVAGQLLCFTLGSDLI